MVLTYRCDLVKLFEERVINGHHRTFLRIDYNIIDSVFREQATGFERAVVDFLDVRLARPGIDAMRPDVAGITHQRATSAKEHRRVMNGRMQNHRAWRSLLFQYFGERNAVAIEFLVFALSHYQGRDIQGACQ